MEGMCKTDLPLGRAEKGCLEGRGICLGAWSEGGSILKKSAQSVSPRRVSKVSDEVTQQGKQGVEDGLAEGGGLAMSTQEGNDLCIPDMSNMSEKMASELIQT
jgi:hypothetical protein